MSQTPMALADIERVPFGSLFSEQMACATFADGVWGDVELTPVAPFQMHPAAHVLHYSSEVFEGLKAYRWSDGSVRIFRLDRHVARMRQSTDLVCLPFPGEATLEAMIRQVVDVNRGSIPEAPGALYVRPTLIGTEANIGAAGTATKDAILYVLNSPVGNYFAGGEKPLRILVDDQSIRTPPGFGTAKTGGNYAAALRHVIQARQSHGADQVLFCPNGDVQETGASNFLLIRDGEVLTKPLDDTFLHGVTRDCILRLAEHLGYRVTERQFTVAETLDWAANGGEAALSGTAAVLTGVGTLIYQDREYQVGDAQVGPHTVRLRQALTAVQTGTAADEFGWLTEI